MLLVSASIRPSPIHGYGCFTNEPISKGQVIWVFDPRIDGIIPCEELASLPAPAQAFLNMYGYVTTRDGARVIVLCGDHAKHMNHADRPNTLDLRDGTERCVAVRDIAAGEELTCNYYEFDGDACLKLGAAPSS